VYPGDLSEDSESDSVRPYTNHLMPIVPTPTRSRATSVVSDGGEQNHLALGQQPSNTSPGTCRAVNRRSGRARSRNVLQTQIYSAMQDARNDDASLPTPRFLPKDQLCQVINTTTVYAELLKCLPHSYTEDKIQEYTNTICDLSPCFAGGKWRQKSYRLIFAVLVLVEKTKCILSFLDENVSDLDLPLVPVKEFGSLVEMQRRGSQPNGTPHDYLNCFGDEEWSPSSLEQFDRYQWFMLAPFFSHGRNGQVNHYPLDDQHILPFVTWSQAENDDAESQGGYGRVIMVRLHPAHHKLGQKTNRNCDFAVKQLLLNDRTSFEKERMILKKFSGANSHRHIVSLLATYEHRKKYHFIFDRAQSDLGRFWQNHERPVKLHHSDMLWIADQCYGITEGLCKIHRHKTFKKRPVHRVGAQSGSRTRTGKVKFPDSVVPKAHRSPVMIDDRTSAHVAAAPNRTFSSDNELPDDCELRYGRHGDINPQNILWFGNDSGEVITAFQTLRGTLKIADFGTAEMNSQWSKSGKRDVANTMTYRPPECDSIDKTIRQEFDIWCLGCVFLEFVCWTLGGADLVGSFAWKRLSRDPAYNNDKTDTYFELVLNEITGKMEAKVKDSVFEVWFSASSYHVPHTDP
jgi:serine/threonine protein kinase